VLRGGVEAVFAGGVASGAAVSSGGTQIVSAGGAASGTTIGLGGHVAALSGGNLGNTTIVGGGRLSLSAGVIDTASVTFVSTGGTLDWGGTGLLGATLVGFAIGDTLDFTALAFTSSGTAQTGTLLTVTEGGQSAQIQFAGGASFPGAAWHLGSDGHGGTTAVLLSG
jgi:autotransporter passenger strand-loop-strand repeat protein